MKIMDADNMNSISRLGINKFRLFTVLLILLFVADATAQKMYKWKDENGTMHYSKNAPPEEYQGESLKLQKQRKGDLGCCSVVRRIIGSMLTPSGMSGSKDYQALVGSENFSAAELNNFVGSKVRSKLSNYEISQSGYDTCINAGFKFCRVPLGSFDHSIDKKHQSWSGSGFYISEQGHIITNEHVVRSCKKITIQPEELTARLIAKDSHYDLAVLKVNTNVLNVASFRVDSLVLGEKVITAGFPYKDILSSSIKITTGIVGSLAGIKNDPKVMQITAPIQPGNSGGPLIDDSGNIIGVIVSKLNSEFMIKLYKDIPQNVNFAIKGNYVKKFLNKHSIKFEQTVSTEKQDVTQISQSAQGYTVEVNCIN